MARLFEDIFSERGTGDVRMAFPNSPGGEKEVRAHSLVLSSQPFFARMLGAPGSGGPDAPGDPPRMREARSKEVVIEDDYDRFVDLLRFIYTNQLDVHKKNVAAMLSLADKYCVDEIFELCLKWIQANFSADAFFDLYVFTRLQVTFQNPLKEQLMASLRRRRHLCMIAEDPRWRDLPVEFVEEVLQLDDLPINSEAEILALIAKWVGTEHDVPGPCTIAEGGAVAVPPAHSYTPERRKDVLRLLGCFRKNKDLEVRIADIQPLFAALNLDIFADAKPRAGNMRLDPGFVIHRHEKSSSSMTPKHESFECPGVYHLGSRDLLQQEPGWSGPGCHRCRVTIYCQQWAHRERYRKFEGRHAAIEGSPLSEAFGGRQAPGAMYPAVRMPRALDARGQVEAFDAFDAFEAFEITARDSEGSESDRFPGFEGARPGAVVGPRRATAPSAMPPSRGAMPPSRGGEPASKFESDPVDHQIVCGYFSGYQRHGVRFSQKDRDAIYRVEDLNGKRFVKVGGSMWRVSVDLELNVGEANQSNICRCRMAVLRDSHILLEESFDVSALVPLHFYVSSSQFDANSTYSVTLKWVESFGSLAASSPRRSAQRN